MSQVVYAVFESAERAWAASERLGSQGPSGQPLAVQVHVGRLDPLSLPEEATTTGAIWVVAVAVGAGIGGVLGLVGGSWLGVTGLDPLSGTTLGVVCGGMIGALTALMQGVRAPKPALREAASQLATGRALLTVAVDSAELRAWVEATLEPLEPCELDRC